ncbi:hypothetical protein [Nonomuraea sp. NPDC052265]|uniref:hypothetical protein n=1 Tax=Nonomuraea sp. NPDC052265 TaxID=3364374 RepID=UPI0037C609F9
MRVAVLGLVALMVAGCGGSVPLAAEDEPVRGGAIISRRGARLLYAFYAGGEGMVSVGLWSPALENPDNAASAHNPVQNWYVSEYQNGVNRIIATIPPP